MAAEEFDGDWLALREPFDAVSRNPTLAQALLEHLDEKARPRFLDLGAGTGSLTRWLGHFVARPHAWVLADADAELMSRAFDTMMDAAEAIGWRATWPQRKVLLLHSPEGAWRIEGILTNLTTAPDGLPLENVDAVTCSALCDLVSEAWLTRLAAARGFHEWCPKAVIERLHQAPGPLVAHAHAPRRLGNRAGLGNQRHQIGSPRPDIEALAQRDAQMGKSGRKWLCVFGHRTLRNSLLPLWEKVARSAG